jgi:hypothetical protein
MSSELPQLGSPFFRPIELISNKDAEDAGVTDFTVDQGKAIGNSGLNPHASPSGADIIKGQEHADPLRP